MDSSPDPAGNPDNAVALCSTDVSIQRLGDFLTVLAGRRNLCGLEL
jgi:hypothetical protein